MTKDQILGECMRMRELLEGYDAAAGPDADADHHKGLRKRLTEMEERLAALERD